MAECLGFRRAPNELQKTGTKEIVDMQRLQITIEQLR